MIAVLPLRALTALLQVHRSPTGWHGSLWPCLVILPLKELNLCTLLTDALFHSRLMVQFRHGPVDGTTRRGQKSREAFQHASAFETDISRIEAIEASEA